MKYLWTKRPNNVLLVRIRLKGRKGFTIPVSIWALEMTLESLGDLVWVFERILQIRGRETPVWSMQTKNKLAKWIPNLKDAPFSAAIRLTEGVLKDLRKQGKFRMVEVEDGDTRVIIDLI